MRQSAGRGPAAGAPWSRASSWRSASTTPTTSPESGMQAAVPGLLQQADHLRGRARRARATCRTCQPARLRGRAGARDRGSLPPRARRPAHEVIAGYTITNDVTVRDWQLRTPTMTMGKSFDTHGPLDPGSSRRTRSETPTPSRSGPTSTTSFARTATPPDDLQLLPAGPHHLSQAFTLGRTATSSPPAPPPASPPERQPFPEGLLIVRSRSTDRRAVQTPSGAGRVRRAGGRGGGAMRA